MADSDDGLDPPTREQYFAMSARPYAVDDPLVGLFLRLAAHPDAAFIFTIFTVVLWNLSQYSYALFAGFIFQQ